MTTASESPKLAALQSWFIGVCTDPESVARGLEVAAAAGELRVESERELEAIVRPSAHLTASQRLDVYRESYMSRLVECLVDDYPALQHALGEEAFHELARAYVIAHPSSSPSLNYFGRKFAGFCAERFGSESAFPAELARLEWAVVEAIHAPESVAISPEVLAQITPEQWPNARFTKSAALTVFRFEHPVNAFYQAFREDLAPAVPSAEASAVAVYRDRSGLWRADLSDARCALLEQLLGGAPLGEALERAASDGSASEADVLAWFSDWMRDGFFSSISV